MTFFKRRRLVKLYKARQEASERFQVAVERKDTRAQHEARRALQAATTACLRAEGR